MVTGACGAFTGTSPSSATGGSDAQVDAEPSDAPFADAASGDAPFADAPTADQLLGYLVVLGGNTEGPNATLPTTKDVFISAVRKSGLGPWSTGASLPVERANSAALVIGDRVYVVGGFNTYSQVLSAPVVGGTVAGWRIEPSLVLGMGAGFGGAACAGTVSPAAPRVACRHNGDGLRLRVWEFLPKEGTFAPLEPVGPALGANGAIAFVGHSIVVSEENTDATVLGTSTPAGYTFAQKPGPGGAALGACAAATGNTVYMFGGVLPDTGALFATVADAAITGWTTTGKPFPGAKPGGHACVVAGGALYVIGGGTSQSKATRAVYRAQIEPGGGLGEFVPQASMPTPLTASAATFVPAASP